MLFSKKNPAAGTKSTRSGQFRQRNGFRHCSDIFRFQRKASSYLSHFAHWAKYITRQRRISPRSDITFPHLREYITAVNDRVDSSTHSGNKNQLPIGGVNQRFARMTASTCAAAASMPAAVRWMWSSSRIYSLYLGQIRLCRSLMTTPIF